MNRIKAFTIVELLVVLPAMLITSAIITTFLVTLYQNILIKNGELELGIEAQSTLFSIRDDLFFANRFAGEPQPDASDPFAPAGGWNAITHNALIVYEASYDKTRQIANRQLVFKRNNPYPCESEQVIENQYSTNTVIYFLRDSTFYKRTRIPDQTANCLSTFRTNTCPAGNTSASCPQDVVLAKNVKNITFTYYDRSGDILNTSLASDIDKFIQVQRAEIILTLEKTLVGEPITATATINIKKTE